MIHKQKKPKFIIATLIFALIMLSVIILTFSIDKNTNAKITNYVESIGWIIENDPVKISHYKIPDEFDSVFNAYNEIQQKAGFDLSNFKGKTVASYSYKIINHELSSEHTIYATILIYKGEIIGGEISSGGSLGFIYEITNTKDIIPE